MLRVCGWTSSAALSLLRPLSTLFPVEATVAPLQPLFGWPQIILLHFESVCSEIKKSVAFFNYGYIWSLVSEAEWAVEFVLSSYFHSCFFSWLNFVFLPFPFIFLFIPLPPSSGCFLSTSLSCTCPTTFGLFRCTSPHSHYSPGPPIDELYSQKLKYKAISEELDHALNDMTSM